MPTGQPQSVEPLSHRKRVNVLGALPHDGKLHWKTQQRPTVRDDAIGLFDGLAAQAHTVQCIVVVDNASFHKGKPMDKRRQKWMAQGLFLYHLSLNSPELNRIEILCKQTKYFWRHYISLKGQEIVDEIKSLMKNFRTAFTINFS